MKITGDETNDPSKWLQKIIIKPIAQVKYLKAFLGNQGFIFDFDVPNSPSYLFLLRDSERCSKFINQVESLHLIAAVMKNDDETFLPPIHAAVNEICEKSECCFQTTTEMTLYILGFISVISKGKLALILYRL